MKTLRYPSALLLGLLPLGGCGVWPPDGHQQPAAADGAGAALQPAVGSSGRVVRVVDGDTVVVDDEQGRDLGRVRVLGIDTPEIAHRGDPASEPSQCFGDEATTLVRALVQDQVVTLLPDPTQPDRDVYDRLLRYVDVDGRDLGLEVLTAGAGREFSTGRAPVTRSAQYRDAETAAINAGAGMWGQC